MVCPNLWYLQHLNCWPDFLLHEITLYLGFWELQSPKSPPTFLSPLLTSLNILAVSSYFFPFLLFLGYAFSSMIMFNTDGFPIYNLSLISHELKSTFPTTYWICLSDGLAISSNLTSLKTNLSLQGCFLNTPISVNGIIILFGQLHDWFLFSIPYRQKYSHIISVILQLTPSLHFLLPLFKSPQTWRIQYLLPDSSLTSKAFSGSPKTTEQ